MTDLSPSPGKATLLPCPFCGGEDIELWTGFGTQADISCQSCSCERSVQVADMRETGEPYPEFDNKTFRYPDWLIERTNSHLIEEWNTRTPAQRAPGWIDQNHQIDRYGVALMMIGLGCADPAELATRVLSEFGVSLTSTESETPAARVPKVRTSHHRNKEEAARLQTIVDEKYAASTVPSPERGAADE